MTSKNIRNYCAKALNISEQQGVQDGLAFLIGEKFSLVYCQLKTAHNKIKYLYLLTPKGISEKTKLTVNFMKKKLREYDELKKEIENIKK